MVTGNVEIRTYKAFEQLFRNSHEALERIAYYFVRDREAAQDVVSKTFMDMWESRDTIDMSNLLPYAYVSVRNACLNYRRNSATRRSVYDKILERDRNLTEIYSTAIENTNPSELLVNDIIDICKNSIDRMPPQVSAIFMKSRINGMTYTEIAESMNISTAKVDKSIRLALKSLREALSDYLHIIIFLFIYISRQ